MNKLTILLCLFMLSMVNSLEHNFLGRKVYIVYMGALPPNTDYHTIIREHYSMVRSVTGKSYTPDLIVSNYGKSFNGFAAWLTEEESKKIAGMSNVVSVFPNGVYHLDRNVMPQDITRGFSGDEERQLSQMAPM